jgi:malate dehydrogenase
LLDEETLNKIVERTRVGGGELVQLMGTSAWYAPGAAAAQMVEAIVKDEKRIFPVCARLDGEYGMKDIFLGVPVKLGRGGIESIIEVSLNDAEKQLLEDSAVAVRSVIDVFNNMQI